MNQTGIIVSIVSVLACLFLATRHSGFRSLGKARVLRLALIWTAIILGLAAVLAISGLRPG